MARIGTTKPVEPAEAIAILKRERQERTKAAEAAEEVRRLRHEVANRAKDAGNLEAAMAGAALAAAAEEDARRLRNEAASRAAIASSLETAMTAVANAGVRRVLKEEAGSANAANLLSSALGAAAGHWKPEEESPEPGIPTIQTGM